MSENKHSTTSIKDSDDEFIEFLAEKILQRLVESGTLTPWLDADGAVRYRIIRSPAEGIARDSRRLEPRIG